MSGEPKRPSGGAGANLPGRVQLAVFRIGEQSYALDIMRVKEVINPPPVTPIPRAPATLEGVIELRGQILPVVDLRKRFERPVGTPTRSTKVILARLPEGILGLLVDGVREVVRVATDEIRPPPVPEFFSGVCRIGDEIVLILDLDRVLSSDEKISVAGIHKQEAST